MYLCTGLPIDALEKELLNSKETAQNQAFELRTRADKLDLLEKQLIEAHKNADIANKAQTKEIKALNQAISSSEANLNKALGKLEILNS